MAMYEDFNGRVFPAKAYRNAVKTISGLDFTVDEAEQVSQLPGIGSGILKKIDSFLKTGTFPRYEEFKASTAAKVKELADIKGIGVAKAKTLASYGITTLEQLKAICRDLQPGDKIYNPSSPAESMTFTKAMKVGLDYEAHTDKTRMPIDVHDKIVTPMLSELKRVPGVSEVSATGSARRYDGSEGYTVGDADLVVGVTDSSAIEKVRSLVEGMLDEVVMSGPTKISGIRDRRQVDVRIVKAEDYGSLMLHSTGPMSFNVQCRKIAMKNGWKLNEYGLFDNSTGECIAKGEREILEKLGIGWVDPTKRKDFHI
jgi:DNA polymerase (family 10)